MKKISCCLIGLFLSLLFAGCEKEPSEEPVVTGSKPSIEVAVSPEVDSIQFGGSASLSYSVSNGDSFTINGVSVTSLIDKIDIPSLKKDTTFSFFAKNKFGQTTETRTIFVKKQVNTIPLPTMVLSVSPSALLPVGGGVATISWSAENTDIVTINNIQYDPVGSFSTNWIKTDTAVFITAVGSGGSKTFVFLIDVEKPLPVLTLLELLCLGPRRLDSSYYYMDSIPSVLKYLEVAPCEKDDDLRYFLNGVCKYFMQGIFCEGGSPNVFINNYTLVDSTLCAVNGECVDIVSISGDGSRMILKQKSWEIVGENSFPITIFKVYKF